MHSQESDLATVENERCLSRCARPVRLHQALRVLGSLGKMTQTAGKLAVGMSVFALVVTIYSLSELHTISVQHAEQERQFMQSQQSGGSTETPKVTGGAIRKSLETGT